MGLTKMFYIQVGPAKYKSKTRFYVSGGFNTH